MTQGIAEVLLYDGIINESLTIRGAAADKNRSVRRSGLWGEPVKGMAKPATNAWKKGDFVL